MRWYGPAVVADAPALINCAALAMAMASGQGSIVEASDPEHGDLVLPDGWTASLGWYVLDGCRYVIGVGYPDGVRVAVEMADGAIECPDAGWGRAAVAYVRRVAL